MTTLELIKMLSVYPQNTEIKRYFGPHDIRPADDEMFEDCSDSDTYNEETDEIIKGNGARYLLFNPPIQ